MPDKPMSAHLRTLLAQRCLLLFVALIALLVALPFLGGSVRGQAILVCIHIVILLTAIAAVGRTWLSFVVAAILVLPVLYFRLLSLKTGEPDHLVLTYVLNAVFYLFVLAHLLRYVFRQDVMSQDKLYGAVAAYILIAIFWSYLHALTQYFYPGAYAFEGTPRVLDIAELIYFSFAALSTAGFGDIAPVTIQSRYLTILEMVAGVMFVAILIARLTGVYPIVDERS